MRHWLGLHLVSMSSSAMGGSDRLRTSRIGMTPEHNGAILIVWMSQYFVELDGEAIQMADVQWTKVGVESIVQQAVVDGEVEGRMLGRRCWHGLGVGLRARRPRLVWRTALLGGIWEGRAIVGRVRVRCQIEAICMQPC